MATIQKEFNGKLNSDVSEFNLPPGDYLYAMNLRIGSSDGQNIGTVTNVKSNEIIPIQSSLQYLFDNEGGTVKIKTIGTGVAEDVKKVFWFVYRSDNRDFILEYDSPSKSISKIFVNLDDTDNVDISRFSLRYPIYSVNLVNGDLKWTDAKSNPGSINIDKFKSGYYGVILEKYIRAVKPPSLVSPVAQYVSNAAITYNRLKKNLFQFQSLLIYDGNERSVYSPMSNRPIPIDEPLPVNDNNPAKNNGISVSFDVGGLNVKSVELTARNGINDWFLVNTFDKSVITKLDQFGSPVDPNYDLSSNKYTFTFYNDGNYNNVDASEQILYFDYLPDIARTQAYASGSMIYAGITEGYDAVDVSGIVYPVYTGLSDIVSTSSYAWKTNSRYQFGLVYFNSKTGKSTAVNNISTFNVSTKSFGLASHSNRVSMDWNIVNAPPKWADKYMWVRTNQLTHEFFLFWTVRTIVGVTQSTDAYYDLYIDTIESFDRANNGSILSYEFVPGDRISVHRQDGSSLISGYDVEIVDFAKVTPDTIPATLPSPVYRLRIKQNAAVATISAGALIEVYRPKKSAPSGENLNVFYEFGQVFGISNPGTDFATHSVTSGSFLEGDVFYRQRKIPTEAPNDDITHVYTTTTEWVEDPNFSDFYISNYSSNGRPNIIDKNNARIELPATYRFSETLIPNTLINGLSRFYPDATIDYDITYGPVQRIELRDNYIVSFQQLKVGAIPLYATVVEQQTGVDQLILSEKLLNKVRYYFGDYGIGDFPEAMARNDGVMFFVDAGRGVVLRLDGSGINPISQQASMDNFFNSLLKQYARGNQNINGGFEKRFSEYVLSFENEDVVIFDRSDPEDSAWDNSVKTNIVDRSSISIITGPAHGSVSLIEPGVIRYHGATGFTGPEVVVYGAHDVDGNVLANKNLCFNVISHGGVFWAGVNPACFTVMSVLHKYYLNRQLYNSDGSGPYLCNGTPIVQENYNPSNPAPSLADPDYVHDVADNCFCLNECPDGNDTFINDSPYRFIIDEGEPSAYALVAHETHKWTFDGQSYFTLRAVNSASSHIHVYQYDCHTVDPFTVTPIFDITNTSTTYHIPVFGGNTIFLTAGSDPVTTC